MVFLSNDPNFTGLPDVQAKGVRYGKAIACILAGTQSVTKYKECGFMLTQEKERELQNFAREIRIQTIRQIGIRGFGHIGGCMSIADLLSVLYGEDMKYDPQNPSWEGRDWLVCSKGHAGPAIYAALALKGFFPMEWMETLNQPGTNLPSHCDRRKTPGIDMTTGSLGQGLSIAAGIAQAYLLNEKKNTVYCIMGDGESQEGQNWEAILYAAQQKLGNLILFVDDNKAQIDGYVSQINEMESYVDKFKSFHWDAVEINGHDYNAIHEAILNAKAVQDKPSAKSPEVSTTSGLFCAQFLKSEKKISKRVLAKSVDLNLYARDFGPLFRSFFGRAALFRPRQNVEFKQVVLLVLLNRHSECMRHDVGTGKARNIQEDSI